MKVIKPLKITEAMLVSDIPETDEAEYNNGTSYNLGDKVMVTGTGGGAATATHKIYESLIGSNVGNDPTDQVNNNDKWLEVSATNRWKMLDLKVSDGSVQGNSITVAIAPGEIINSLAVFNVIADSITVTVTDDTDGVVYNKTIILKDNSAVTDWFYYFFEPITQLNETALFDLPQYGVTATIQIVFTIASGSVQVGELALGRYVQIGRTRWDAGLGIVDYSRKDRDTFGNPIIVERDYSDRGDFDLVMYSSQVRFVKRFLASMRATPAVWLADKEGEYGALLYGYYRDFEVVLSSAVISECSIQIEGLI